jgi:SAM-dependent methyltransferase
MGLDMSDLITDIANYYTAKLVEHGTTPRGVDWNGEESQVLRFQQLCRVINAADSFSINDLGCGYGALLDYLKSCFSTFNYRGFDISFSMIEAARRSHLNHASTCFVLGGEPDSLADYSLASGIFNVRLHHTDEAWQTYIEATLDKMHQTSRIGFAFNCLTKYSHDDKKRDYLYYADPCWLFQLCKQKYAQNVALFHDYGLYEFTIIVRKIL